MYSESSTVYFRYERDYYINDSKKASGSRRQKTCKNLELLYGISDNDRDDPDNALGDIVSDSDSFYNSSQKQSRYMHLFKRAIPQMTASQIFQKTPSDLKRSQSVCSVRTFHLGRRLNDHNIDEDSCKYQMYRQRQHEDQSQQNGQVITQLERDTLYNDIRRYSFSSRRGTKNFVINPLYNE